MVQHPQVLGDSAAGTVVEVGPDVERLAVGDKVFGFVWRTPAEKAQQEYCTADEWQFAKVYTLYFPSFRLPMLNTFSCLKASRSRRRSRFRTTS
jgi:NADPH:quinone reductase-like Zn-dependent oxidoreductase